MNENHGEKSDHDLLLIAVTGIEHIQKEIKEMKADAKDMRNRIGRLEMLTAWMLGAASLLGSAGGWLAAKLGGGGF